MPLIEDARPVTDIPAASSEEALAHFSNLLRFETDCWDVHFALENDQPGFVVLDVRSPDLYDEGHVDGAVNLPHRRINERNLAAYDDDTTFVVCRPVKKMIGGVTGWIDEGFVLV
jgi:rhodanese-related sulfurtransferase